MGAFEWILVIGVAVGLIWLWGRQPFHHRGVRITEFAHFLANLERDADGSRMFIEDEETNKIVIVEKVFSDESRIEVVVRTRAAERLASDLQSKLELQDLNHAVRAFEKGRETWIATDIECGYKQWMYDVRRAVVVLLECVGSNVLSASYHIHFEAKPGKHMLRKRYERILADPESSDFRRRVAARALERLRQRQESRSKRKRGRC